ncbi:dicarboxylate/amino acid:cation symporter [Dellaglioa carnosa]|uniref:dicarboxylate/amino acid:cation symporter n=1 Tax=Dellaglioa carnosa TaxID=2995136 RepID=UPI0022A8A4C9|nr:dicarboxylate/amino acid:cation symporter [Dellaglioa carnosa]MCZ2493282.1 dicarboxylate/amino acid:cation symporter [Dellaglioa carnosa]
MTTFFNRYKTSLFLLLGLVIGGIVGLLFKEQASVLKPLGDLFLNLMYMILVPLVFFSISSAIAEMSEMKRLGKIMMTTLIVFLTTAFIAGIIGYIGVRLFNPIHGVNVDTIKGLMGTVKDTSVKSSGLETLVNTFTVNDFYHLLSKDNMLQLIIFSILMGTAASATGKEVSAFTKFLSAGNVVVMRMVKYVMYYAPIGLGCFFANIIGNLGPQIAAGYLRSFVLYLGITAFYFFVMMSLYAFIAGGKAGFTIFWKNVSAPAVTAIATSSSAASIPVNLEYSKKMGVTEDIANTIIPLGANTHKDGSVIGGVLKTTFLFAVFGKDITSVNNMIMIICVSFLVGVVMGAIPGGGMVAETLICSIFGFPMAALPLILIITTIIDIPATLLNSTGNTATAMLVTRFVEGKDWLKDFMAKSN